MKKLKRTHKNLMISEASYIYCKRHNLDYNTFIDDVFMNDQFDCSDGSEFDNICKDLRYYTYSDSYKLIEITNDEYEMCIDKFGENLLSEMNNLTFTMDDMKKAYSAGARNGSRAGMRVARGGELDMVYFDEWLSRHYSELLNNTDDEYEKE
jgi:hypothetical protein